MKLSPTQTAQLNHYLKVNGLAQPAVREDVLDHICTDIEYLLTQGQSFNQAYKSIKEEFTPREINRIQKDTEYYLTIKNTVTMLKGIFISGYAAVSLIVISFGFRGFFDFIFMASPEVSFMISSIFKLAGTSVLVFIFLPLLFKYGYKRFRANLAG